MSSWPGSAHALFLTECQTVLNELQQVDLHSEEFNGESLGALAHRLKGSAGFFGHTNLRMACGTLESALKESGGASRPEISLMVQKVTEQIEAIMAKEN